MIAELVSGGSFVNSVLATGQTCRNSPCQKLALPFLFSTVDILVPEISLPNESPWSCALWPLGGENLRERGFRLWLGLSGHSTAGKKHKSSRLCHMFLWWSHDNSAAASTEISTIYRWEEKVPEVFGQECPWSTWRFKWGHVLHQFIS